MRVAVVIAVLILTALSGTAWAGSCAGICQSTSLSCAKPYVAGLCPGSSSYECCEMATPSCNGQCQENTLSCGGHYVAGDCPGGDNIQCCVSSSSHGLPNITRAQVINTAQKWVADQIPYCQCNSDCCGDCPYCGTTRCDCSGYVSACWGLTEGYDTQSLPQISHQISKSQLMPGDITLWSDPSGAEGHTVIFAGWTDSSQTKYYCYQEAGCYNDGPHVAYYSAVPYPMSWAPSEGAFLPYRYNAIQN